MKERSGTPGPFEEAWRKSLAEMRRALHDVPAEVERRLAEKKASDDLRELFGGEVECSTCSASPFMLQRETRYANGTTVWTTTCQGGCHRETAVTYTEMLDRCGGIAGLLVERLPFRLVETVRKETGR